MFNIEVVKGSCKREVCTGKICIGDFEEYFDIYLGDWEIKDYLQQWLEGIDRILMNDKGESILLTSGVRGRVFHKIGEDIFISEQIFSINITGELFNRNSPYKYLKGKSKNRKMSNEEIEEFENDGIKFDIEPMSFSEWRTNIDELREFRLKFMKKKYFT